MNFIRPIIAVAVAGILGWLNEGCDAFPGVRGPSDVEKSYIMELTGCVDRAKTKEESVECRRQVNHKYGLCKAEDWPKISPCD